MNEAINQKELWTQKEVADYFRVVPGTVHNWRKEGLLKYFQAPGSRRVLFYKEDIIRFRDDNTISKKGGDTEQRSKPVKNKPAISAKSEKVWRI